MITQLLISISLFGNMQSLAASTGSEVKLQQTQKIPAQTSNDYGIVESVSSLSSTETYEGKYVRWGKRIFHFVYGKWEETDIEIVENPVPDDGVYIVDGGGHYLHPQNWNANAPAAGVAVVWNGNGVMLSPQSFSINHTAQLAAVDNGLKYCSSVASAMADDSGYDNTRQLAFLHNQAAIACQNYTFVNGEKGFLLSAGQAYKVFNDYGDEIDAAMEILGGWQRSGLMSIATSSMRSSTVAWTVDFSPQPSGMLSSINLAEGCMVVPAADLPKYCFDYPYASTPEENMTSSDGLIHFADNIAKGVCMLYDSNGDGELSYKEAADVLDIDWDFASKKMKTFDELVYFTGLKTIFEPCFQNCTLLESITIPSRVASVGYTPFGNCPALRSINVDYANEYYCSLDGVLYDKIVSALVRCPQAISGDYAIPSTVSYINQNAMKGCSGITSLDIPKSVNFIDYDAFASCTGLKTVYVHWTTPLTLYSSFFTGVKLNNVTLMVPTGTASSYQNADIWSSFGSIVEYDDDSPEYVVFTDNEAKRVCLGLWDLDGDNRLSLDEAAAVTSLGGAFCGNGVLQSFDELRYFTGLVSISKGEFDGCRLLSHLILPESVKTIGEGAFRDCVSLLALNIPKSVVSIGDEAFEGMASLREFTVTSGNTAFRASSGILYDRNTTRIVRYPPARNYMSFSLPTSVKAIGVGAFSGCTTLVVVVVPNSVTSVGRKAFKGCNAMQKVSLPSAVSFVGDYAFAGCYNISDFYWNAKKASISTGILAGCTSLTDISLPIASSVKPNALAETLIRALPEMETTSIGDYAFARCRELVRACLPEGVKTIGGGAFLGCSGVGMVRVPSSVTAIGDMAYSCAADDGQQLQRVLVNLDTPPAITEGCFADPSSCVLYVPKGSEKLYAEAEVWREFGTILPLLPGDIDLDGDVSLTDVVLLVDIILNDIDIFNNTNLCPMQSDVTGDGDISINDVMTVVNLILGQ